MLILFTNKIVQYIIDNISTIAMPRCIYINLEGVSSMGMITDIATCSFNIRRSEM